MITIVSGLPRSGTSLMMQMLAAGGLTPLNDGIRVSDVNNPRGYYEWEKIKQLPNDPACIAEAEGKAVKVISALLRNIPYGHEYRILFMERPLEEVVASQGQMIKQLGTSGAPMPSAAMMAAFETHLRQVSAWLKSHGKTAVRRVEYTGLLGDPRNEAACIQEFLHVPLDIKGMARQVDTSLYRNRAANSEVHSAIAAPG